MDQNLMVSIISFASIQNAIFWHDIVTFHGK